MKRNVIGIMAALALAAAPALEAQILDGSATGIAAPTQTLNFSEVPMADGAAAANNWSGYGVSFQNLYWGPGGWGGSSWATPALYNFYPCCGTNFSIIFANAVSGASFNAVDNSSTSTVFSAYLGATLVSQFTNTTPIDNFAPNNSRFWGFSGVTFDRIDIYHQASGFGIDNLSYTTSVVPEPATVGLLATGLIGILGVAYRRRREEEAA